MASELRVNTSTNRVGLGTITYTDTGPIISGITTGNNFKTGTTNVHSTGVELVNINTAGATATFGGDLSIPDKIIHAGDTDTCIRFPGTDIITMERSGSEVFRVDSSGLKIPDKLMHTGDPDTFLEFGTNTINFDTGGSTRLHINSDGRFRVGCTAQPSGTVGGFQLDMGSYPGTLRLMSGAGASGTQTASLAIGGSNHHADLHNGANSGGKLDLYNYNSTDGNSAAVSYHNSNGLAIARILGVNISHSSRNGALVFMTSTATYPTEKMRLDKDGRLGINLTSPTRPLHIASDEDLTSFTGTTKGAFCISNSDYANGEYSAIDFTYTGSDNPVGRIATKITGGGSSLHFGTSNNYSSGITNEALMIASDGEVFMGSAHHGTTDRSTLLSISGAYQDPTGVWTQVGLYSSDSQAANKGGSIGFGGQDGSTTKQQFAAIKGAKENGTSGNYAGYMAFYVRPAGAVSQERLRITSAGNILINNTNGGAEAINMVGGGGGILISRAASGSPSDGQTLADIGLNSYSSGNSCSSADVLIRGQADGNHSGSSAGSALLLFTKPASTGPGSAPTERLRITKDGHLRPAADNTYDLGAYNYRWKDLFVGDAHFSNRDSANEVDGTWGDWTLQEGESKIFMINNRTGKKYSLVMEEE